MTAKLGEDIEKKILENIPLGENDQITLDSELQENFLRKFILL